MYSYLHILCSIQIELQLPIKRDILYTLLSRISHKWQEFAIFLGLLFELLESIQRSDASKEGGKRLNPLEETLVTWLKKCPNPQLDDIILRALRNPVVSELAMTEEVEKKYKGKTSKYYFIYECHTCM